MKKKSDELQYLADSLIIENLLAKEFKTANNKLTIIKQAGVFDILGGVASSIKDQVKSQINPDEPGGIIGGVFNLLAPSALFRLNPVIGILYLIGTSFGINITTIFTKIMNILKPKLEKGISLTIDEVNSIGKNVVSSEVGSIEAKSSYYSSDMLIHLRELESGQIKTSQDISSMFSSLTGLQTANKQTLPNKIPWLSGSAGASPIQKIFGDLFASRSTGKAKWLLGGFVIWIIKTVLVSAGLLTITGIISKSLTHKNNDSKPLDNDSKENATNSILENKYTPIANSSNKNLIINHNSLHASGRGEQIFPNDDKHLWIVPLVNGDIAETLIAWTIDIYPELNGNENKIVNIPSFRKTVQLLQNNHHSSAPNSLAVPKPFNNRKQVVDLFINDLDS